MDSIFIIALVAILFLSAFIEFIFREGWTSFYFNYGIVIYKKSFSIKEQKELDTQFLENEINNSAILQRNMLFKKQPDGSIFFRERMIDLKFVAPVMHGLIIREHYNVTVIGRANWSIFLFFIIFPLLLFKARFLTEDIPIFFIISSSLMFIVFFLIIPYFAQVNRYNRIISLIKSQLDTK